MMKNELINQYEIQSLNDDGNWETCVEFPAELHSSQESMDAMIDRLQMYRDSYNAEAGAKFRLVLRTERTLA